jgi:hypothetical protein
MEAGSKYWDDLQVVSLAPAGGGTGGTAGGGDGGSDGTDGEPAPEIVVGKPGTPVLVLP